MTDIAIIIGSTRPRRRAAMVADWVLDVADREPVDGVHYEIIDLAEFDLPLLDEEIPAAIGAYANPHTRVWAQAIDRFDGFVFVTPEYNHSMPAALKNAIDYLFAEWSDKAAGFVSYGLHGGVRAVEHLRLTLAEVKVAAVRSTVALSLFNDFELTDMTQPGTLTPGRHHEPVLHRMLGEIVDWTNALAPLRAKAGATV
ncbi:MAG TPA: NAD(P)H-dependent oxidoreductase [Pseudonocardiaceae bacterium]|nr:NAD(P)H-dependent oxidoreductase [Pseudonocardiaceae bacterium]